MEETVIEQEQTKPMNAYEETLKSLLGDEGVAVSDWLNKNTTNEEFYEQPMNIYRQERLLIHHAIGMYNTMTKLSKVLFSVSENGKWVYKSPYSAEDYARVALYHVLGNIAKFKREKRNKKDEAGKWQEVVVWAYNENRPTYGTDAEQAMLIINEIFNEYGISPLSRDVEVAILNIAGIWDNPTRGGLFPTIYGQNQLALLANLADTADNYLIKE